MRTCVSVRECVGMRGGIGVSGCENIDRVC